MIHQVIFISPCLAAAKELQKILWIVAPVTDSLTSEDLFPFDVKAVHISSGCFLVIKERGYFISQFGTDALVGVQRQDPFRGNRQVLQSPVPLPGMTLKRMRHNFRALFPSNFHGSIAASGIDDKHLAAKSSQTPQAGGQVRLLVMRKNGRANATGSRFRFCNTHFWRLAIFTSILRIFVGVCVFVYWWCCRHL